MKPRAQKASLLAVENGDKALRVLTQEEVDVLLTDIVMPGLNGIDLARRATGLQPDLRVMFLTAYASKTSEALYLGKLLYKPLRANEIDAELRTFLALR
jgi:two-component system cell cycle response regulator CpdR